jgi:hypothetical protein
MLFLAIQAGYLVMYCAALYHMEAIDPSVVRLVIVAALLGIPVRLYLISTVALAHPAGGKQFARLFPALVVMDGAWAASPLLISNLRVGLELAAVAGLAYLPFSQRTLIKRIYFE